MDLEVRGVPALSYFGATVWQQDVFDQMNTPAEGASNRKFFMLGGKGGVGKTSSAASLAVKFASLGEATLVVSTDPAHSLSDVFEQDLRGGLPVPVSSPMGDIPLFGMELDLEQARAELRSINDGSGGAGLSDLPDRQRVAAAEVAAAEVLHVGLMYLRATGTRRLPAGPARSTRS